MDRVWRLFCRILYSRNQLLPPNFLPLLSLGERIVVHIRDVPDALPDKTLHYLSGLSDRHCDALVLFWIGILVDRYL